MYTKSTKIGIIEWKICICHNSLIINHIPCSSKTKFCLFHSMNYFYLSRWNRRLSFNLTCNGAKTFDSGSGAAAGNQSTNGTELGVQTLHWKKKWSHFDLKSWVTGGTKIRPGIPSNWIIFESIWLDIESQFNFQIDSQFRVNLTHF